jgi:hypothetical protein
MWSHLIAIVGLSVVCGAWVALQRWIARRAPEVRGPEDSGGCGSCSCGRGECEKEGADDDAGATPPIPAGRSSPPAR